MKNTIFTAIMIATVMSAGAQTITEGKITSDRHFKAEVLHVEGEERSWMEWPLWQHNEFYSIKAKPSEEIEARFITCQDTTTITVHGLKKRTKHRLDLELDGRTEIVGKEESQ